MSDGIVVEVADRLYQDWRLEPGALVLSGGLTAPVPMRPGSVVSAEFDGLGTTDVYG